MKNQIKTEKEVVLKNATKNQNKSMCIILSPIPKDESKLKKLADQVEKQFQHVGYEMGLHIESKLIHHPSSKYPHQNFLQRVILDNAFLNFILFPKLSYFLKEKKYFEVHLDWFQANKIQIYFHDKGMNVFDSDFNVTSEFQSILN